MSIIPEGRPVEKRKRSGKALYLLLVPPLLLIGLLVAALVRPIELHFGPIVFLVLTVRNNGGGSGFISRRIPVGERPEVEGHSYTVTGEGWAGAVALGRHAIGIGSFRGHRN